jgi:N-acyl-L-homoserine lactone synthetase
MHYVTGTATELGTSLWQALGRYRHRVFVQHLGWSLPDASGETEWDCFDRPDTVYVLALSAAGSLRGCARLLPTTRPYLLGEVFPQLLDGQPAPHDEDTWELSRFAAVDLAAAPLHGHTLGSPQALDLLLAAMREAANRGASALISVSPTAIQRILRKGGFKFSPLGQTHNVGGQTLFACGMPLQTALLDMAQAA